MCFLIFFTNFFCFSVSFLLFPFLSVSLLYLIHLNSPYFGLFPFFYLILLIFVLLWCDGGVSFSFVSILHNGTNYYILQAIKEVVAKRLPLFI